MCNVCGVRILDHSSIDLVVKAMTNMDPSMPSFNLDRQTAIQLAERGSAAALALEFLSYHGSNRGPDSGGFATHDGYEFHLHRDMGPQENVLHYGNLDRRVEIVSKLKGNVGIAHRRYTTTGILSHENIQPFEPVGNVTIAHNGNLINDDEIKNLSPFLFNSTSDSEMIQHFLAVNFHDKSQIDANVRDAVRPLHGAYSVTALIRDNLLAFRDRNGYWPLHIADLNGILVVNSEVTPIMKLADAMGIGVPEIRQIPRGELVFLDSSLSPDLKPLKILAKGRETQHIFDLIYLRHHDDPESTRYRVEAGRLHAQLEKVPFGNDYTVSYAPSSGKHYAVGFSDASGLEVAELVRKKTKDRIFLLPTEEERLAALKRKYGFKESYEGAKAFFFDDSIVRDTTMSYLVGELGKRRIEELHVRIGSAPIITPDHLGIHTPTRDELIAHRLKDEWRIEKYFEAIFYGFDGFKDGNREYLINETTRLGRDDTIENLIIKTARVGRNRNIGINQANSMDDEDILQAVGYREGSFTLKYLSGTPADRLKHQKRALSNAGINPNKVFYGPMMPGWSGYPQAMRHYLPKLAKAA